MKSRLLNLGAAVSLMLCVAMCVLWARSISRRDALMRYGVDGYVKWTRGGFISDSGVLTLDWANHHIFEQGSQSHQVSWDYDASEPRVASRWGWLLGFGRRHEVEPSFSYDRIEIAVPYWFLAALLAIAPGLVAWTWRRRRRRETNNLCLTCGYDFRATPEKTGPLFARCPECGTEMHETPRQQTILAQPVPPTIKSPS